MRTTGSPTITLASGTVGLVVGQPISGAGFAAGTYIVSIDSANQITLSANASSNGTSTYTFSAGSSVGLGDVLINGGTLGGTGFLGASSDASNLTFGINGGKLAPGASPGILTVNGGVDFTTTGLATFEVELDGITPGLLYDQLAVNAATGSTSLIDLDNVTLDVLLGFTPVLADTFTIIDNNTGNAIVGNFLGLADNSTFLVGSTNFRIDYDGGISGGGFDVVLTVVPVPEPSGLLLVACGVIALFCRRLSLGT